MPRPNLTYKRFLLLFLITGVYFAAGKVGLHLALVNPSASAVWPPTGIALAAFLWWGLEIWPAILLGAFLVNLTTAGTPVTSFAIAIGNTLEGVVGAYLINRYARGRHVFERSADIFKFVGLCALGSTLISATVGTGVLLLGRLAPPTAFTTIWMTWWQGDTLGALLVTPLLILWGTRADLNWSRQQKFEAPLILVVVCLAALAGFCSWFPFFTLTSFLRISCIPLVIWAAFRLGPREAVSTTVLLNMIALWGTLHGYGPFAQEKSPNDALLHLQIYMGVVTIMGLTIGVEVSERKQAARALIQMNEGLESRVLERTASYKAAIDALQNQMSARSEAEERFQRLLDSNIIGFMIVTMEGKVLDANEAFLNALGYSRDELKAGAVGGPRMTPPEYATMDEWVRTRLNTSGYCPPFEKEYIRKDGSRWPVLVGVVRLDKPEPHCVCFVIDVTERRKAQSALQEAYDELEKRVNERTTDLTRANANLEKEIVLRRQAEEQLRTLSLSDPLTGLYNRRGFLALADQHVLLATRDKKPFLFFFLDVDGLKTINDTLGHVRGDQALIKAAEVLRETFRKSDIIARVGGDEFAVVATEVGPEERGAYVARLRQNLERLNAENNFPFIVSLSMGAAVFDLKKMYNLQELMSLADEDLYRRKRTRHQMGLNVIRS